jgi:predicted amidohydrolase YtcJ
MILENVRVVGGADRPVDVTIVGGTIAAIGLSGDTTHERLDLEGRFLLPGLWDNHVHFTQWALVSRRLDVSAVTSAAAAAQLVAAAPAGTGTLVGYGFRDGLWPDAPNLSALDAASDGPVVLVSADVHAVWLNSAALREFGFAGHPTGLLREADAFRVQQAIGTTPDEQLDAWAGEAAHTASSRGVVGIVDYEMAYNRDVWMRRIAGGLTSLRVDFGIYPQHLNQAIAANLRTGQALNELLTVGRFKVITDGSLNTRTAFCYDEYPGLEGQPDSRGLLTVPFDQLVPLMTKARDAGLESAVHAIGDHANALAIDAFERVGFAGRVGCRGTIEHAQLVSAADLPRMAAAGITASVQPEHAMDDRDVADRYWPGRTQRAFVLRSLLEAGAALALGSDAPVAPLDPWVTMAAAVTRSKDGREAWHPEQSISAAQALHASTRTSVAVGELADLVVTEENPLTAVNLRKMKVAATFVGGRQTFSA